MKATMPPTLPVSYLCVLFLILSKARREGLMSIEEDIEEFAQSSIFLMFPELQSKPLYFEFLRDVLRLMVSGTLEPRLIKMYTDASERALLKTKKPDIVLFDVIRTTLLASVNECPPQIAVDFGRQAIPFGERPSFIELEQLL